MWRTVVVAGCMLVVGVTLGALLVGHQAFFKKGHDEKTTDVGPLGKARRSVIQLLTETPGAGAVYTIWGRSECPNGASLIYKGIVGGGSYSHTGGGSEYICLVDEPEWNKSLSGNNGYSLIYGTEFKAGDELFNMENVNDDTLVSQNAVCAMCHIRKTVQVMIPGRMSCIDGWHREYYGYLMSSQYNATTQRNYICVDIAPEADRSGRISQGGSELWPVEAYCGSLPCPDYESGKELTCVVCSIVRGGSYSHTGGGSEYICLVDEPEWNKSLSGNNGYSLIHGIEFRAGDELFNMENVNDDTLVSQNAVCAMCHIQKTVQVMIPGRMSCIDGWHREYYGYLMSSQYNATTQRNYICVDIAPEADRSGRISQGGSELWPVEAYCGSLPCPDYESGKELTCVVCSK